MADAMSVFVRYDTLIDEYKNSNGDTITRRERYETMSGVEKPPELEIPEEGLEIWYWYAEISDSVQRVIDGVCRPIPPSEYLAWMTLTERKVRANEYEILRALDRAYCKETNKDLQARRNRESEQQKSDVAASKQRAKR